MHGLPASVSVYKVGGAVRDKLLGRTPREIDWVVVAATPEIMKAAGFQPVGKDFPVFLHPETHEEYALARTERKQGQGYHGFVFHAAPDVTLEDDLVRRDFTMNAIAEDEHGALIDPFNGQADIQARQIRHVSAAFAEDPLRVLRAAKFRARFHAEGFQIAEDTLALLREMTASGELETLAAERVWQETRSALLGPSPSVYFQTLREAGALRVLFPEIDRLFGVPQPEKWHPEIDTGVHVMMVLEQAASLSEDLVVRFAALAHDFGKGTSPPEHWPSHRGHEERGVKLIRGFCERLRVPNDCRDLAIDVSRWHTHVHRAFEIRPDTALKVIDAVKGIQRPERFDQLLLACEADARGRTGFENSDYPQGDRMRAARAAAAGISAADVSEDLQGPALGEAIRQARSNAIREVWQ